MLQAEAVTTTCQNASPLGDDDAELLRLGAEFESAWANEDAAYAACGGSTDDADDRAESCSQVTMAIVRRIQTLTATTLDGLRVKAKAISWCHAGEDVDLNDASGAIDIRLADSIVRDLLAM